MILLSIDSWLRAPDEIDEHEDREMVVSGPVLALCQERDGSGRYITIHVVSGIIDSIAGWVCKSDGDVFEIIEDGQWPDEACAAAAQLALMGKVVDGDPH